MANKELFNLRFLEGYKNKLMEIFCTSPEIINLLTDNKNAPTPYPSLAYSQVYPCTHVPTTDESGKTFICYTVDVIRVQNKSFLTPVVYIWEFTHKSKMRLPDGGIRTDRLAAAIDTELNGNRNIGLGTLELVSAEYVIPADDFEGKLMTYYATEHNRIGSKKPPAVRDHYS